MEGGAETLVRILDSDGAALHGMLTRITLRQDAAEDLMQDLFVKLMTSPGFAAAANKNAFVRRAAINLAFDWRRRRANSIAGLGARQLLARDAPSPLAEMERREDMEQLLDAIGALGEADRYVTIMRHVEGWEYEGIAHTLGKTAHQVRAIAHRAITQLRELMTRPKTGRGKVGDVC
jgi:RNA polymerase sigma factor (sigma-70 family)